MAEGPDPLNRLREQVNCPVCLDVFKQPKILTCTHAFCKDCIDHLPMDPMDGGYRIQCPTCREPTTLPRNGSASSLRPAFLVNTLIELYHSMKTHVPESGEPRYVQSNKCLKHDRPLEMYCEECQEVACSKCDRINHHEHNCGYIADLFDKQRREIDNHLQLVGQQVRVVLDALDGLNTQQEQIAAHGKAIKSEIDATTARLVEAIQRSGARLKGSVDALVQDKLTNIAAQIKEGQMFLMSLKSSEQYVQDRLCNGSQHEILREKKSMVQRLRAASEELTHIEPKEKADIVFQHSHDLLEKCRVIGEVGIGMTETRALTDTMDTLESSIVSSATGNDASETIAPLGKSNHMTAIKDRPSIVYIYIPSIASLKQKALTCHLEPEEEGGVATQCEIKLVNKVRYKISFTAQYRGLYHMKLQFKGVDIPIGYTVQVATTIPGLRRPTAAASGTAAAGPLLLAEDGGIATIDKTSHTVRRSDSQGGGTNRGICHAPDNHILVVSSCAPHVTKYNEDHSLVATANTSQGSGPLQFKKPRGIAVSSTAQAYVCDTNNHRIQVLNPDLTFSHTFGGRGSGCGQFRSPHDLAIDPRDDTLYVCDHGNNRIQKLSSDGTFIDKFVVPTSPRCVALDAAAGVLYVTMQDYVVVYTCEGEPVNEKPPLNAGRCMGLAVDDERVYVCDYDNNQVIVI